MSVCRRCDKTAWLGTGQPPKLVEILVMQTLSELLNSDNVQNNFARQGEVWLHNLDNIKTASQLIVLGNENSSSESEEQKNASSSLQ